MYFWSDRTVSRHLRAGGMGSRYLAVAVNRTSIDIVRVPKLLMLENWTHPRNWLCELQMRLGHGVGWKWETGSIKCVYEAFLWAGSSWRCKRRELMLFLQDHKFCLITKVGEHSCTQDWAFTSAKQNWFSLKAAFVPWSPPLYNQHRWKCSYSYGNTNFPFHLILCLLFICSSAL